MTTPESQVIQLDVCGNAGSKLVVIQANGLRITLTTDHNGVELSTGDDRLNLSPIASNAVRLTFNGQLEPVELETADRARRIARGL